MLRVFELLGVAEKFRLHRQHLRQIADGVQQLGQLGTAPLLRRALIRRDAKAQQIHHCHLHRVRLGAGHRDLRSGVGIQAVVRLPRDGRPHHVNDGDHRDPVLLKEPQRGQGIGGLAALRNHYGGAARGKDGVAVAQLAGHLHLHRQPRQLFDDRLAHHAAVHGGAAGGNIQLGHVPKKAVRQAVLRKGDKPVAGAPLNGIGQRPGLLVDLLLHKAGIAALLGLFHRPVGGFRLFLQGGAVGMEEGKLPMAGADDLFLLQQVIAAGIFNDRRYVGGDIAAAVVNGGDQRAAPPDAVNGVLLALQQHTKGVSALHFRRRCGNGGQRRFGFQVGVEQRGGDFGVGLGRKAVAFPLQPRPQRPVVFNDAVVDQRDPPLAVGVGVCVVGDAVGGPAGMPDAAAAVPAAVAAGGPQVGQPSGRFDDLDAAVIPQRHAGTVIAPVFQVF